MILPPKWPPWSDDSNEAKIAKIQSRDHGIVKVFVLFLMKIRLVKLIYFHQNNNKTLTIPWSRDWILAILGSLESSLQGGHFGGKIIENGLVYQKLFIILC